jgi:AhpD family alkylhydroperoxidase
MAPIPVRLALRRSLREVKYVHTVPVRKATGLVKAVYRQLERDFGLLAPPIGLHSVAPEVLAAAWTMLRESLVAAGVASRADKEIVATSVSRANTCPYCVEVHSMTLGSLGHGAVAAALGDPEATDLDEGTAALAGWAAGEIAAPPAGRSPEEIAELVGVAVTFHYLNRMVNVFLGPSPLPTKVPEGARATVLGLLGRFLRPTGNPIPGLALNLLPEAAAAPDLAWANENPRVQTAFARAARAVEQVPVPAAVRELVRAELVGWDGSPMGISRSWVAPLLVGLPIADRPVAKLALLTALASSQVDEAVIAEFRERHASDQILVEVVSWASLTAARALGARLPLVLAAL